MNEQNPDERVPQVPGDEQPFPPRTDPVADRAGDPTVDAASDAEIGHRDEPDVEPDVPSEDAAFWGADLSDSQEEPPLSDLNPDLPRADDPAYDDLDATAAMPVWSADGAPGDDDPDARSGSTAAEAAGPEATVPLTGAALGAAGVAGATLAAGAVPVGGGAATTAAAAPAAGAGAAGASVVGPPVGPPARRLPRALVIVGAIVLVAALIAGGWWWYTTSSAEARDDAIEQTATTYLTAVADGDADAALATLSEQPANRALLTDEVLAASRETGALTNVAVTGVTSNENNATASVTYNLGTQPVSIDLPLVGDGRTSWKIADGTSDLAVNQTEALTVNGATITEGTNPVFPGTYTAAPTTDLLTLTGEGTAVVSSPLQETAGITVTHELSETGRARVLETVKTQFDTCLAATVSRPPNCPFGVDDSTSQVTPDSVRFQLLNDPWAGFAPQFDLATMSAKGTFPLQVNASANVTFEGRTGDVSIGLTGDRNYTVDLTKDPLTVVWQ